MIVPSCDANKDILKYKYTDPFFLYADRFGNFYKSAISACIGSMPAPYRSGHSDILYSNARPGVEDHYGYGCFYTVEWRHSVNWIERNDNWFGQSWLSVYMACPEGYTYLPSGLCAKPREWFYDSSCPIGNPIKPATGQKIQTELDYGNADNLLSIIRNFSSYHQDEHEGMFGRGWFLERYERHLIFDKEEVLAVRGLGDIRVMKKAGEYYKDVMGGGDFVYVENDEGGATWNYFDAISGVHERYKSDGKLMSLSKDGIVISLSYGAPAMAEGAAPRPDTLISVSDNQGRSVYFLYGEDALVRKITGPAGLAIEYSYEDVINVPGYQPELRLSSISTYGKTKKYHYEHTSSSIAISESEGRLDKAYLNKLSGLRVVSQRHPEYLQSKYPSHSSDGYLNISLTGITDERGVRYASFQYDAQGRAIESRHGEADRYQFVFGDNQTTVINPLGKETRYRYANLGGVKRLTQVEGLPSAHCAGANKAYSYYPNGQLQTRTDWQGVVTRFEYNSRGLVSREIEAEGTPEQRETHYDYHPRHPWPIRITSGLNISEYDYDDNGNLRASRVLPHAMD